MIGNITLCGFVESVHRTILGIQEYVFPMKELCL